MICDFFSSGKYAKNHYPHLFVILFTKAKPTDRYTPVTPKSFYILYNRTIVLEYFKNSQNLEIPFYNGYSMYGSSYPD